MKHGEVVLVDYPYSDRTGSKVRPALFVQADQKNAGLDDTIVALITSRTHRRSDTHDYIDAAGKQTGLRHNSVVQCENLYTIDQKFIFGVLGSLSPESMQLVDDGLKVVLGL